MFTPSPSVLSYRSAKMCSCLRDCAQNTLHCMWNQHDTDVHHSLFCVLQQLKMLQLRPWKFLFTKYVHLYLIDNPLKRNFQKIFYLLFICISVTPFWFESRLEYKSVTKLITSIKIRTKLIFCVCFDIWKFCIEVIRNLGWEM